MLSIAKKIRPNMFNLNFTSKTLTHSKPNSNIGTDDHTHLPLVTIPNYHFTHTVYKNILKSSYEAQGYSVEQLFTGCLAIYSYYIESGDECFLIDPLIDIQKYSDLLSERKKKLKGIFISHYHADYLSGQHQLKKKFKCQIYMGPKSGPSDQIRTLADGDTISLGNIKLQCIHTPGHTEESSCLLAIDQTGKQDCLFTGDTVFLNEVGRPDLAVKTNLTAKDLASMLYDSLQKIKKLNGDIRIYPGHGSGSACGKSIGKGDFCTLATQMSNNYGLKAPNRESFINMVLKQMPSPPQYFGYNANINKFQPYFHEKANQNAHQQLSPMQIREKQMKENIRVLDVRSTSELKKGIIEGSLCIGFDGGFVNWVGTLIKPDESFILYGSNRDQIDDSIARLLRIGYINIQGYAHFDFTAWKDAQLPFYIPDFVTEILQPDSVVLDVRKYDELKNDGVVDTKRIHLELSQLFSNPEKLKKDQKYVVHCKSGYRAKIAYSFLKSQGFTNVKAYPSSFDSIFESSKAKKSGL